jgi:branched-chain amino acid transport system substrate-binding protein
MKVKSLFVASIFMALLVIASFITPACAPAAESPAAEKLPYKLGFLTSQTGYAAALGQQSIETANLLIEQINAKGGIDGHLIEAIPADDACDETKAITEARKLADVDQVICIFGPIATGVGMALAPVIEKMELPLVTSVGSMVFDSPVKKWSFRPSAHEYFYNLGFDAFMKKYNVKTVGILYQNAAFGKSLLGGQKIWLEAMDLSPTLVEEGYSLGDKDMTAQLTKLAGANIDALVIWGSDVGGANAIKQAREMGFTQPIWLAPALLSPDLRDLVIEYMEMDPGVFWIAADMDVWEQLPNDHPDRAISKAFNESFYEKYNKAPGSVSSTMLATMTILEDSLNRAKLDTDPANLVETRANLRDAIEETHNLWVGMGEITMSPTNHHGIVWGTGWIPVRMDKTGKPAIQWDLYDAVKAQPAPPGYYPH